MNKKPQSVNTASDMAWPFLASSFPNVCSMLSTCVFPLLAHVLHGMDQWREPCGSQWNLLHRWMFTWPSAPSGSDHLASQNLASQNPVSSQGPAFHYPVYKKTMRSFIMTSRVWGNYHRIVLEKSISHAQHPSPVVSDLLNILNEILFLNLKSNIKTLE